MKNTEAMCVKTLLQWITADALEGHFRASSTKLYNKTKFLTKLNRKTTACSLSSLKIAHFGWALLDSNEATFAAAPFNLEGPPSMSLEVFF